MNRTFRLISLILSLCFAPVLGHQLIAQKIGSPLVQGHAHNDYLHRKPLWDALEQGFCSVEVDVHLMKGRLVVAHIRPLFSRRKRTLQKLYLEPLDELLREQDGKVFPGTKQPLTLMVDFKSSATETYPVLKEALKPYEKWLSRVEDGKIIPGAARILISGARPSPENLSRENPRYVFLDGRPGDLGGKWGKEMFPRISTRFGSYFEWKGSGPLPPEDQSKLAQLLAKAPDREIRFWATPEKEETWRTLLDAGVNLINTDKLAALRDFLRSREDP